jgi:hypothetical protein
MFDIFENWTRSFDYTHSMLATIATAASRGVLMDAVPEASDKREVLGGILDAFTTFGADLPGWATDFAKIVQWDIVRYQEDLARLHFVSSLPVDSKKILQEMGAGAFQFTQLFDLPEPLSDEILRGFYKKIKADPRLAKHTPEEIDKIHDDYLLHFVVVSEWLQQAITDIIPWEQKHQKNQDSQVVKQGRPRNIAENRLALKISKILVLFSTHYNFSISKQQKVEFISALFQQFGNRSEEQADSMAATAIKSLGQRK